MPSNYVKVDSYGSQIDSSMNENLISQYQSVEIIAFMAIALILVSVVLLMMRRYRVRSLTGGMAIYREFKNIKKVRKDEKRIIRFNEMLNILVNIISRTPFALTSRKEEYLEYNLRRIGLKSIDGETDLTPKQFNAMIQSAGIVAYAVSVIIAILFNAAIGVFLLFASVLAVNVLPGLIISGAVTAKDDELRKYFFDLYLKIHNILYEDGKTPLAKVISAYAKECGSDEVKYLADICDYNFSTYGEYAGAARVAEVYREMPEVRRLMNIIQEVNSGADVKLELDGFKKELFDKRFYEIEQIGKKRVERGNTAITVVVMIILGQIAISSFLIYFKDMFDLKSGVGM